jgi:biopolymer transport protein ExbD
MKRIAKIKQSDTEIPTSSQGDIAFLLIIFFMLTTVFRSEYGLKLVLPEAEATERIMKRRNVAHIWLDKADRMSINDNLLDMPSVTAIVRDKVADNADLIMVVRADKEAQYGKVNDVLEALKEAGALKVTFATEFEKK